jgi:hypothetical protein
VATESGSNVKVKFLVKDQTDYSEIFVVTTNISPSKYRKTGLAFFLKLEKKKFELFVTV